MAKFYTLPKGTKPTAEVIKNLLLSAQRKHDLERYDKLDDYYQSRPVISRSAPHKIMAITNHARYIAKINVGYLLGTPVAYSSEKDITKVVEAYTRQTLANLDVELATDASVFGHAFERLYVDEDSKVQSVKVDPRNIVLVHDDTVKHNKMFAIIYAPAVDEDGKLLKDTFRITVLDAKKAVEGKVVCGQPAQLSLDDGAKDGEHAFGEVPVVEYVNDKDRVGDFEPVISLIDAYNILQSDRIIDRERLVDAILAAYGVSLSPEQQKNLKNSRILANIPTDAKVEYVVKNINETDANALRDTILSDIHKISMTPDMSDENFAGNSSGVALSYKLLAFEQHAKDKERYFERGLKERFAQYCAILGVLNNAGAILPEEVDIIFKRALPRNDLETAQMLNLLSGMVDKETLISQLSFVRDASSVLEALDKENEGQLGLDKYGSGEANDAPNEGDQEDPENENEE